MNHKRPKSSVKRFTVQVPSAVRPDLDACRKAVGATYGATISVAVREWAKRLAVNATDATAKNAS